MKKIVKFLILICLILMPMNYYVNAEEDYCTDESINDWAEKVEVVFEEVKNEEYPFSYLLSLSSIIDNIKVVVSDTYSNGEYDVELDTDFNNYVIGSEIHFIDKEYNFKIYGIGESACSGKLIKTIKYVVPAYNHYNDTLFCEENPDDEICGTYKNVEETDKNNEKIMDYYYGELEEEEEVLTPWYEKLLKVLLEYALYVIVPLALVSGIYLVIIKIQKKRSEDK